MPDTDTLIAQAKQDQTIHYANCQRLIQKCTQVKNMYTGAAIADIYASQLVVDGESVSKTLGNAHTFLTQPGIVGNYNPDFISGLATAATAITSDTQYAAAVATGMPNSSGITLQDMLVSIQNWTNNFRNPYNFDNYPAIAF